MKEGSGRRNGDFASAKKGGAGSHVLIEYFIWKNTRLNNRQRRVQGQGRGNNLLT